MYTVDFPDQLQQKLDERAFATGCDVVDLIQVAVIEFVGRDPSPVGRRIPDPPLLSTETTAPLRSSPGRGNVCHSRCRHRRPKANSRFGRS